VHTRFVVNFREPRSGRRKQLFFERQKDAVAMRDALLASVLTGTYAEFQTNLSVGEVVRYWLESRRNEVKKATWDSYRQALGYIVGPLLLGTKMERYAFARRGQKREEAQFVDLLGPKLLADLTTADIRSWHKTLTSHVSSYTANVAKKFLRAALSLAAEDFHLRVPPMPSLRGRGRAKPKKSILTPDQVGRILQAAIRDEHRGIYYAFPFLTGVRPSEQLALLWQDVDLEAGTIHIKRMQERDGSITDFTKTAAGTRDIPMSPLLKTMLERWRSLCPRDNGRLHRVFPALGAVDVAQHKKRGGPLSYANFRATYWRPAFAALGLPYVTPHSARALHAGGAGWGSRRRGTGERLSGHARRQTQARQPRSAPREKCRENGRNLHAGTDRRSSRTADLSISFSAQSRNGLCRVAQRGVCTTKTYGLPT
jgi:integrase